MKLTFHRSKRDVPQLQILLTPTATVIVARCDECRGISNAYLSSDSSSSQKVSDVAPLPLPVVLWHRLHSLPLPACLCPHLCACMQQRACLTSSLGAYAVRVLGTIAYRTLFPRSHFRTLPTLIFTWSPSARFSVTRHCTERKAEWALFFGGGKRRRGSGAQSDVGRFGRQALECCRWLTGVSLCCVYTRVFEFASFFLPLLLDTSFVCFCCRSVHMQVPAALCFNPGPLL